MFLFSFLCTKLLYVNLHFCVINLFIEANQQQDDFIESTLMEQEKSFTGTGSIACILCTCLNLKKKSLFL